MLSHRCGLFPPPPLPPPVISSKQGGKRHNKSKYQRGLGRLGFEKKKRGKELTVYTDISRQSSSRYEKDIVIHGGIMNSKKANKIVSGYRGVMCLFLSPECNVFSF